MSEPPTPVHARPNEEVAELPLGVMHDISLNPELDDSGSDAGSVASRRGGFTSDGLAAVEGRADLLTPPFESAYAGLRAGFAHRPLTSSQLSSLISYVDAQLLQIQRAYVKAQAGLHTYPLRQLVGDVDRVSQVVWLSISPEVSTTVEYYIKMLSDLEDYVGHYRLQAPDTVPVLLVCQLLDARLSVLFDTGLLTRTQFVRAVPIVSRLRLAVLRKLVFPADAVAADIETSKLFAGTLDRSNCGRAYVQPARYLFTTSQYIVAFVIVFASFHGLVDIIKGNSAARTGAPRAAPAVLQARQPRRQAPRQARVQPAPAARERGARQTQAGVLVCVRHLQAPEQRAGGGVDQLRRAPAQGRRVLPGVEPGQVGPVRRGNDQERQMLGDPERCVQENALWRLLQRRALRPHPVLGRQGVRGPLRPPRRGDIGADRRGAPRRLGQDLRRGVALVGHERVPERQLGGVRRAGGQARRAGPHVHPEVVVQAPPEPPEHLLVRDLAPAKRPHVLGVRHRRPPRDVPDNGLPHALAYDYDVLRCRPAPLAEQARDVVALLARRELQRRARAPEHQVAEADGVAEQGAVVLGAHAAREHGREPRVRVGGHAQAPERLGEHARLVEEAPEGVGAVGVVVLRARRRHAGVEAHEHDLEARAQAGLQVGRARARAGVLAAVGADHRELVRDVLLH